MGVVARGREREREGDGGRYLVHISFFLFQQYCFYVKCDVEPWGGRAKEEAKEVILTRVEREGGTFPVVGAVTCTHDT